MNGRKVGHSAEVRGLGLGLGLGLRLGLGLELASCRVNPALNRTPTPEQVKARMDEYTAYLPYISRISPLYLPYISPISPCQVKARMDEYTAINSGDAADHLHGASAAVKQSLHPKN